MDSYAVIFGNSRVVVFDPPVNPWHPAAIYWQSAEGLADYFKCGCKGDACTLDAEDQVVAIMPSLSYPASL
jgi:hypothetical protein